MLLQIYITEQTIYDCFFMSKDEFFHFYQKLLPNLNEFDLKIIWSGIRENFESRATYLHKSSHLDKVKLAEYKKMLNKGDLTEEEEKLIKEGNPEDEIEMIMKDEVSYKWNSDKIKEFVRRGYDLDTIKRIFKGTSVTESYIKQYMPKI